MRHWPATVCLLLACAAANGEVKSLPSAQWPRTVAAAVPHIVAALSPAQKSIVRGTGRDSLFLLQGEWGEDIKQRLGLGAGNAALVMAACGTSCTVDQATVVLMEAAWAEVQK